jgi:DNA-directed RNA polymerase specialized sigma24 family protein
MSGTTRKTILEEAIAGDEAQWQAIWELYRPLIAGELSRVISGIGRSDLDDILQNVFTVLFLRLPEFESRGPGSFRAFLREIARRQGLAWLKADRRHRSSESIDGQAAAQALAEWSCGDGELAALLEQEHQQYWQAKLLEECARRCQDSPRRQRDFAIFRAVCCDHEEVSAAAERHRVSLATAYRALHESERLLAAIREEWRDVME